MSMMRPVMSWHYSKNGSQLGPVTEEELKAKGSIGEVLATDLVWREGMADWKPLAQVPDLQSVGMVPQVPQNGAMGSVPMQQPYAYPEGHAQQIPNYLWQSIVATVLGALTCWLVAMPLGIVAIVFAAKVEGLQRSGDFAGAMSASKSAKGWMIGSFACFGLCLVFIIFAIVMAFASGEFK